MKGSYLLRIALLLLLSVLALALTTCSDTVDNGGSSPYVGGPWDSCTDEYSSAYNTCVNTECGNCVGFQCLFCLSYCGGIADQAAYSCCYGTFTGDEADECLYYLVPKARPCPVSGRVATSTGVPVPDVALSPNAYSRTVFTDSNGDYRLAEIDCSFDEVTPSKTGYCFSPESRFYNLTPGTEVTGQNYTALLTCYSISGTITDTLGAPVAGVSVEMSGDISSTALTDANGLYSFNSLSNGMYTITPGILVTPDSRTVTIYNADIIGQDFVTVN